MYDKTFIVIKKILYKYDLDTGDELEMMHYFNSIPFDVVSMNNIPEIITNVVHSYENSLTNNAHGSNWRFRSYVKFTLASTVIKSA